MDYSAEIQNIISSKDKAIRHQSKQIEALQRELEEYKKNIDKSAEFLECLENIIAEMPGHVYWKDRNGVYLGCNDSQAKFLGFSSGKEIVER